MKRHHPIPPEHRALSHGVLAVPEAMPAARGKQLYRFYGLLTDGTIIGTEEVDFAPGYRAEIVFGKRTRPKSPRPSR